MSGKKELNRKGGVNLETVNQYELVYKCWLKQKIYFRCLFCIFLRNDNNDNINIKKKKIKVKKFKKKIEAKKFWICKKVNFYQLIFGKSKNIAMSFLIFYLFILDETHMIALKKYFYLTLIAWANWPAA